MAPTKRKHKTLTIEVKSVILNRLESGESSAKLAREYNIGKSTISDLKIKKNQIVDFLASTLKGSGKRQTLKCSDNPAVESAIYTWFIQEKNRNTPLNGDIICEKAKFFYKQITQKDDFKASVGWLDKFKKRHGIRQICVNRKKPSSDTTAVKPFQDFLLKKVLELNLNPDQIYNADESGLFWKAFPDKTIAHGEEDSAASQNISKERITFMPCANSTGSHKLKLLVFGNVANPREFKNRLIPVDYKGQRKAWLTKDLFTDWFFHQFVPAVKIKMRDLKLPPKALLLLINAPGYPKCTNLITEDGKITALFLPPDYTLLMKPMYQDVIQAVKLAYRKKLLLKIIGEEDSIISILKKINLLDLVYDLAECWEMVTPNIIKKSWQKVLPTQCEFTKGLYVDFGTEHAHEDILPSIHQLRTLNLEYDINDPGVHAWVTGNDVEESSEIITADEFVQNALRDDEIKTEEEEQKPNTVKHKDAISCLNTCLEWSFENNVEPHQITLLRQLRDKAYLNHGETVSDFKISNT